MNHVLCSAQRLCLAILLMGALWSGCASAHYTTPGGAGDLSLFADRDIQAVLATRPASALPVNLAIARIQQPGYRSYTARGHGRGRFSVITVRDVETQQDLERIAALPEVSQVVPLNRLLLSDRLESERPLRLAAAALHADMILVYTLDTDFFIGDVLRPLTVISLGLSPNQHVRVTTTASASSTKGCL